MNYFLEAKAISCSYAKSPNAFLGLLSVKGLSGLWKIPKTGERERPKEGDWISLLILALKKTICRILGRKRMVRCSTDSSFFEWMMNCRKVYEDGVIKLRVGCEQVELRVVLTRLKGSGTMFLVPKNNAR